MFGRQRPTGAARCQALATPCVLTRVCPVAYTMMTVEKRVPSRAEEAPRTVSCHMRVAAKRRMVFSNTTISRGEGYGG